jgi:hypothetical protein
VGSLPKDGSSSLPFAIKNSGYSLIGKIFALGAKAESSNLSTLNISKKCF